MNKPTTILLRSGTQIECYPMLFKATRTEHDKLTITGCLPNHVWQAGDKIWSLHPHVPHCRILQVLEQRDCKGRFDTPEKSKNSFFKLLVVADNTVQEPVVARTPIQPALVEAAPVEVAPIQVASVQPTPAPPAPAPPAPAPILTSVDDEFSIL